MAPLETAIGTAIVLWEIAKRINKQTANQQQNSISAVTVEIIRKLPNSSNLEGLKNALDGLDVIKTDFKLRKKIHIQYK